MSFEKKMQKRVIDKLNPYIPDLYPQEKKKPFPLWAKILIPLTATCTACAIAIPIISNHLKTTMLERYVDKLSDTYVDMTNVSGFGLWNSKFNGKSTNGSKLSCFSPISTDSSKLMAPLKEETDSENWEDSYDFDPTKDNVLVTVDNDGKIKEVVYKQTNGKGEIRQTNLGYATQVYTSNNFTFVQYESYYWSEYIPQICALYQLMNPSHFECVYEDVQTIIIHNTTGKVMPLKDVIPDVNKVTGVINYTISGKPYKQDYFCLSSMYSTYSTNLWFKFLYSEEKGIYFKDILQETEKDDYELWNKYRASSCVQEDKYGQQYILGLSEAQPKVKSGIVNLEDYEIKYNKFFFMKENQLMYGNDQRMYAFVNNKLNVFGENYKLAPVEQNTTVTMVGLYVKDAKTRRMNGVPYFYDNGILFSAFGETWNVESDGSLANKSQLTGLYPNYSQNVLASNNSLIAMVNCEDQGKTKKDVEGELYQIVFKNDNGTPTVTQTKIMKNVHYISTSYQHIIAHNLPDYKGNYDNVTWNYYLIDFKNGIAKPQLIATFKDQSTIPQTFVSESLFSSEQFYS